MLRDDPSTGLSESEVIRYSYDLQAGSYIREYEEDQSRFSAYANELATVIATNCPSPVSVLDAGAGELISTRLIMEQLDPVFPFAVDGSLSRLHVGMKWLKDTQPSLASTMSVFVANLDKLPFAPQSFDAVYTSHALEPNHSNGALLVSELWRITSQDLFLFEPHYEAAGHKARERMDYHGYIKNLEQTIIEQTGCKPAIFPIVNTVESYNPTFCFHIKRSTGLSPKQLDQKHRKPTFRMGNIAFDRVINGGICSSSDKICFPVIEDIPVFDEKLSIFLPSL